MLEYRQDENGISLRDATFDYLWSMRGYGLLMDDGARIVYTPMSDGMWVYLNTIKPEDFREKVEADILSLIDQGVLGRT